MAGFASAVESGVVPQEEGFRARSIRFHLEGVGCAGGGPAMRSGFAALEGRFGPHHEEGGGAFHIQRMRGDGGDAGSWGGVATVCHGVPLSPGTGSFCGVLSGYICDGSARLPTCAPLRQNTMAELSSRTVIWRPAPTIRNHTVCVPACTGTRTRSPLSKLTAIVPAMLAV